MIRMGKLAPEIFTIEHLIPFTSSRLVIDEIHYMTFKSNGDVDQVQELNYGQGSPTSFSQGANVRFRHERRRERCCDLPRLRLEPSVQAP